jgi:hypothetical protein
VLEDRVTQSDGGRKSRIAFGAVSFRRKLLLVWSFPAKTQRGDTRFTKAYLFLFVRTRSQFYPYTLLCIVRNLALAMLPVIPDPVSKVLVSQVILWGSLSFVTRWSPWRVQAINRLDVSILAQQLKVPAYTWP